MVDFTALIELFAEKVAEKLRPAKGSAVQARLLTIDQAAKYLGRSIPAMHRLAASGRLRTVRLDRRVQFDVQDLDALIEEHKSH